MIKILVDTAGGDKSPDVNIEGGVLALEKHDDLQIIFVGDREVITQKLTAYKYDGDRVQIIDAKDVITCNDVPTKAIKDKTESSLYKAFEALKGSNEINAFVSNGSTGAILVGAVLKLGRIKGIKRPALCPIIPTMNGRVVAICDSGANMSCDSTMLYQFALMASLYMQKTYGVEKPKVALLNVGIEAEKGDDLRKETYQLLSECKDIDFVGNMESRYLLSGDYDVVVCDGFSGNVLCKSTEGACLEMSKLMVKLLMSNKQAALLLKDEASKLRDFMDYNNYGGAVLLGCPKTIVKSHGTCEGVTIFHCIEQAYNMEKNGLNREIARISTL